MHIRYKFEGRLVFAVVQTVTIDEAKGSIFLEFYDGQTLEMKGSQEAISSVKEALANDTVAILDDMEVVK